MCVVSAFVSMLSLSCSDRETVVDVGGQEEGRSRKLSRTRRTWFDLQLEFEMNV